MCIIICGGEDLTDMEEFGKTRWEFFKEWYDLNDFGIDRPTIIEDSETHEFTRYFITSLTDVNEFLCCSKTLGY